MLSFTRTTDGVALSIGGSNLLIRHVIGVGMNYAKHALEQGKGVPERPVFFTKNLGTLCLDGDDIVVPRVCQDRPQVDFEAELGVIVAGGTPGAWRGVKDADPATALSHVVAYCCANDVSARWWQKDGSGGQFYRGKSFDTFCPVGRAVPADAIADPQALRLQTRVNGVTMQDATTADMIFPVAAVIAAASAGTTLPPGTLIVTGTPSGVGFARTPAVFLKPGDAVEVEIERLGTLRNTVRYE